MNHLKQENFRVGWAHGMKWLVCDARCEKHASEVKSRNCDEYYRGMVAAWDHFDGAVTRDVDLAHAMGLVESYSGFHGQADWVHPRC